jgi:hypothetical protein
MDCGVAMSDDKRPGAEEGSMETHVERVVPTAHGPTLNPEYLRQLAAEHQEGLAHLAQNDGPVLKNENAARRTSERPLNN